MVRLGTHLKLPAGGFGTDCPSRPTLLLAHVVYKAATAHNNSSFHFLEFLNTIEYLFSLTVTECSHLYLLSPPNLTKEYLGNR